MARNSGRGNVVATNTFDGGMVADLHVLTSPSNTVTYALNMELVTIGDNQYIFQNIRGNRQMLTFPKYTVTNGPTYDFIPVGLKVRNNIAYILLGAFTSAGIFVAGGIGTFPSPDWSKLNDPALKKSAVFETFSFLHNYRKFTGTDAILPFVSTKFDFSKNRFIDMDIQGDYDGSVNIIFTDNKNVPSIINSRFSRIDTSPSVRLADRSGNNDSNTYSEDDWDRIALIQNNNSPIGLLDAGGNPGHGFDVLPGGHLKGGGYRYYFKYTTQEGNTTELLYESPLIPIANGGLGLSKTQISDKMVRFYLDKLDTSYAGIKVYFAHFSGEDEAITDLYKINYVYSYDASGKLVITHSGLESVTPVDISEINVGFTPIDTIKSIAIVNDRLALAGASSTLSEEDISVLSEAARTITLWEKSKKVNAPYSDPNVASKSLGYWKGEVYEFAAVFSIKNKGLSPAFPVTGMDNGENPQANTVGPFSGGIYPMYATEADGFSNDGFLINNKGLFRTSFYGDIYTPGDGDSGTRHVTYIEAKCQALASNAALNKIVSGFFIVRRQRVKNVLMQGMAVPTLKLPSKSPTIPEGIGTAQYELSASKRYLTYHYPDKPVLGLNAPYFAVTITHYDKPFSPLVEDNVTSTPYFNIDFDTVFVPQPTQIVTVLTQDKAWPVAGGIGQKYDSDDYGASVDLNGVTTSKLHMCFYSSEIELTLPSIRGAMNGVDPHIAVQGLLNGDSPVGYTYLSLTPTTGKPTYKSTAKIVIRNAEKISMDRAAFIPLSAKNIKATLLDSGTQLFSNEGFTAKVDRVFGFVSDNVSDSSLTSIYTLPYADRTRQVTGKSMIQSNSVVRSSNSESDQSFFPYSIISQSYSRYMGIEVEGTSSDPLPLKVFSYLNSIESTTAKFANSSSIFLDATGVIKDRKFVNIGHLANVYRSATGRWTQDVIRDLYKYDSNKVYHSVTDRVPTVTSILPIFRGDGFITRIFKRTTYKNGVSGSKSATASDAGDYGVGLKKKEGIQVTVANLPEMHRDDPGRSLIDLGQIVEIVSFSNINADIRSTEILSSEDSLLYGGDRNFYPNKLEPFGDGRPDSVRYNHGYTGDIFPVVYSRIEEGAPYINTEFPNRVLLSERNSAQKYFNSFRDLKGFNYRDYGVEFGPIVKLVTVKNLLLSIHPTGVLIIGVDDRTLVAEGADVYINTAQALSPTSKTVSDTYGSTHAESIVKTDLTVAGVDYTSSAIWLFEGDKLSIISEFAIKTILEKYKSIISEGNFIPTGPGNDAGVAYEPRVYSSFNMTKHTLYISYVAEHPTTKEQRHIGTVSYSTVLQKWMSTLSEGNKFTMSTGAVTYTTGFSSVNTLWKEDGIEERCKVRGVVYEHKFEIVINSEPALEKILNNIRAITNKSIPTEIVYTTSGDENDAAIAIWGSDPAEEILTQKIFTRESSPKNHLRLGILDENAYYKNSGLYIEVGRIDHTLRKERGYKRIRDKSIKVKFIYTGTNETFLQAIISTLSISYT